MSSHLNDEMPLDGGAGATGAEGAGAFAQRRPDRPHSNLNDDMPDVGSRYAGQPRETQAVVRGAQRRTQMVVIATVVLVVAAIGGLYAATARAGKKTAPVVAAAKKADAETFIEPTSSSQEIVVDSLPSAGAGPEVIAPIQAPAAGTPGGGAAGAAGVAGVTGVGAGLPGAPGAVGAPGVVQAGAAGAPGTVDLLPPPAPLADQRRLSPGDGSSDAANGAAGAGADVPALGDPGSSGLAPRRAGRPTTADRMARLQGFGQATSNQTDPAIAARFGSRRSALAPAGRTALGAPVVVAAANTTNATAPAAVATSGAAATCAPGIAMVPGTRVIASAVVGSPSATSGEALEAILAEPLRVRGVEILPAGTVAYGAGRAFDDGTGSPRLVVTFETYRKPNDEVCTLPGVTYSMTDRRLGLDVPLNHQWMRKTKRVGVAGALTAITRKLTEPKQTAAALFGLVRVPVETPEEAARREAYKDMLNVVKQETNLNTPTTGTLLSMPEGLQFWIVYGIPGAVR